MKKSTEDVKRQLIERDGLRCSISGEPVDSPSDLEVAHIIPKSAGGGDELSNLRLVRPEIYRLHDEAFFESRNKLMEELAQRRAELAASEKRAFDREAQYRKQLEHQKAELDHFRATLQDEQAKRDALIQAERSRLQDQLIAMETQLLSRDAALSAKLADVEQQRARLAEGDLLLRQKAEELEREKEKYTEETRKKIESKAGEYVNEALTALETSSHDYRASAKCWSVTGFFALVGGILTGIYFGTVGLGASHAGLPVEWSEVVFFSFKGLIVIGLFVALAKYCFLYGQSFMHEALKASERQHAINFGKFYLESYGADAGWGQIKEAFEHWNITTSSAFSSNDADKFDPKVIDRIAQLIDSLGKLRTSKQAD